MSDETSPAPAIRRVEHPVWGVWTGNHCSRCGVKTWRNGPTQMCPDCVRETPGTDECDICADYGERICGYHSTSLWYCLDCGHVRRIGNRPARPGTDATVRCCVALHPDRSGLDNDFPRMIRLCYESLAPPRLRRYHRQRSAAWNEASREWHRRGGYVDG